MLQWMGGSRRKVTSSRKSIQNRQKQYFEQRRRQQQGLGQKDISDAQNQAYECEEPRSLDILSLTNLATVAQQCDCSKSDGSRTGSTTPAKTSTENDFVYVGDNHGCGSKSDKGRVQESHCNDASKDIPRRQDVPYDNCSDVSVLELLGDDEPNSVSSRRLVPEGHVAFSVEGLGKVGIGTPAHSPRRYERHVPSPPRPPTRMQSMKRNNSSQYGLRRNANDIMHDYWEIQYHPVDSLSDKRSIFNDDGDEFSNAEGTKFIFSSMPRDAYENKDHKFNFQEDMSFTGLKAAQSWNGGPFGILDDDLVSNKYGEDWANKPAHAERTLFREDNKCNTLDPYTEYFKDITSEEDFNPISFIRERNEMSSPGGMSRSPNWLFSGIEDSQDSMSLLSEESCSASAARDDGNGYLGSHSLKLNNKSRTRHKPTNQKHSRKKFDLGEFSPDLTDPAGVDEFLYQQNKGARSHKKASNFCKRKADYFSKDCSAFEGTLDPNVSPAVTNLCNPKADYFSKDCYAFEGTVDHNVSPAVASARSSRRGTFMETDSRSISDKLMSEDNLLHPFLMHDTCSAAKSTHGRYKLEIPMNNGPPADFINENKMLKKISNYKASPLSTEFPWEHEDPFPFASFAISFDNDAELCSRRRGIFKDSEVDCKKPPETPQRNDDSADKNSLSSNGRTARVADSKKKEESRNNPQELGGSGHGSIIHSDETDEEIPSPMEEVPSQLENCMHDKQNSPYYSQDPVLFQVPYKDSTKENAESKNAGGEGDSKGNVSYQVMLGSYVFQLLCVQKVLMDASEKDIKGKLG